MPIHDKSRLFYRGLLQQALIAICIILIISFVLVSRYLSLPDTLFSLATMPVRCYNADTFTCLLKGGSVFCFGWAG